MRVTSRVRGGPATTEDRPVPAAGGGAGDAGTVRSASAGGPVWTGSGLRHSAPIGGRDYHLKRAGGVWSVFEGTPEQGRKVGTAKTIGEAKAAAHAHAAGVPGRAAVQAARPAAVPDSAGLTRLDDDTAMALYAQTLQHPNPDTAAVARLEADLERRDRRDADARAQAAPTAAAAGSLHTLSDGGLDELAGRAARAGDNKLLSNIFTERDRRFAVAEKSRRQAAATAAPPADAWLYGPDADRDWPTQWATETAPVDAGVDEALAGGAQLIDAYTVNVDAARAGQRGRTRDILRRRYDEMTALAVLQAETVTRGHLLNARGRAERVDPLTLFSGPQSVADLYASEELQRHWGATGRVTYADFVHQALAGGGAGRRRRLERSAGRQFA